MSDQQQVPNQILDRMGMTDAQLMAQIVSGMYIVDIGVVQATDQTTVDVKSAVFQQVAGKNLPATVTEKVEIIWPFAGSWNISIGDGVLLVGIKDYVAKVAGATPGPTDIPLHYSQETMKAIPLYSTSKAAQILIDANNLFHIKNAVTSLYTIFNNFIAGVQGGTYGGSGSPGPFVDTTGKVTQALTELGQLLGA